MKYKPEVFVDNIGLKGIVIALKSGSICQLDRQDFLAEFNPSLDLKPPIFWFARIKSRIEDRGDGSFMMRLATQAVDSMEGTIVNGINPYGQKTLEDLILFFKRWGFEHIEEQLVVRWPAKLFDPGPLPEGSRIIFNVFYLTTDLDYMSEDLFAIDLPNGYFVDLGCYSGCDIPPLFTIMVVDNHGEGSENWEHPIEKVSKENPHVAAKKLKELIAKYAAIKN